MLVSFGAFATDSTDAARLMTSAGLPRADARSRMPFGPEAPTAANGSDITAATQRGRPARRAVRGPVEHLGLCPNALVPDAHQRFAPEAARPQRRDPTQALRMRVGA